MFAKRYGWTIEYILNLTRKQIRVLLISAGDHERLPDRDGDGDDYSFTDDQKNIRVEQKHIDKLRKGKNIVHKSSAVDRLVGKTMEEYHEELESRAKGQGWDGTHKKPSHPNKKPPHPNSPVKRSIKPSKTLPSNKHSVKAPIKNAPVNVSGNDDMSKVMQFAMNNQGGFKMSPRLKRRLGRKK